MNKITLDEYIKRRKRGSAVYSSRQDQYGQGMSYGQTTAPQTQLPANQNGQVPVYRPNQWSRPTMVNAPAAVQPETPAIDATKPTDGAGSNVLTWDDQIDLEIQAAAKKVLEVSNRKFQYNSYESHIYSIMRQEYLKEADLAAGRATAAAAQNAGGFGSSFAVMAGEEARRQVMEGFHDQEDELYAAAQSEFEAERASAFDNYLKLRELKAMEQETATTEGGVTTGASEAAQYLLNTYGMSYSEKAMRQDLLGKGYSEADVNAALESQRKMVSGAVTDYKAGDIGSAISQAGTLDEAYRQGQLTVEEYDEAKAQNSKVIMDNVNKGMIRIDDIDHAALGISDEEWSGMKDGEKKLAVFDSVGQMVKSGAVRESDYYKLLYNDIQEELASEDYQKSKNKTRDVVDIAIVIQDLYDNGYMSEDSYKDIVYNELMPNIEDDKTFKTIVYYARDYDSYGSDTKMAINLMDEQRIIPNIGKYNTEEQQMLLTIARGYNGDKIKRKK